MFKKRGLLILLLGLLKKLVVLSFFIFSGDGWAQKAEHLNFKILSNRVVWEKILDVDTSLKSQAIRLDPAGRNVLTQSFWFAALEGASLEVEQIDGKTRIRVSQIFANSRANTSGISLFNDVEYAREVYLNQGSFTPLFINKEGQLLHDLIDAHVRVLIENSGQKGC